MKAQKNIARYCNYNLKQNGPSNEFLKIHLCRRAVQPNTDVLLAKKGGETVNIVKYFTLVALAAAALGVSACAKKETPPPPAPAPTTGYSK